MKRERNWTQVWCNTYGHLKAIVLGSNSPATYCDSFDYVSRCFAVFCWTSGVSLVINKFWPSTSQEQKGTITRKMRVYNLLYIASHSSDILRFAQDTRAIHEISTAFVTVKNEDLSICIPNHTWPFRSDCGPLGASVSLRSVLWSKGYRVFGEILLWRTGFSPRRFCDHRLQNMRENMSLETWSPSMGFWDHDASD